MITLSADLVGFIILFAWVLIGSFGIPASTLGIIVMGSLSKSVPALITVIIIAFVAVIIGDILAYTLATKLSKEFKDKLKKFRFFRENEPKVKSLLNKHGFSIVFFTRFALIHLCAVTSYVAGFEKMKKRKFISAVLIGEFLFAMIYSISGFAIGEVTSKFTNTINDILLAIVLLGFLGYFLKKYLKRRKERHEKTD